MRLWLVTDILLKLVRWPRWLALHCSKTTHLLSLSHTSNTLAWTSRPRLLLLARHSPGRYLTDASCPWNLPTAWHLHSRRSHLLLLLHRLPPRTHLLHLGCKEWTLASLGRTRNKPFKHNETTIDTSLNAQYTFKQHYSTWDQMTRTIWKTTHKWECSIIVNTQGIYLIDPQYYCHSMPWGNIFHKILVKSIVVYYQCCILTGWATTRLYVTAH